MKLAAVAVVLLPLFACTSPPPEVSGPYEGVTTRYMVDRITLPTGSAQRMAFADDLDGDGTLDNALGNARDELAQFDDITTYGADMIASGVVASSVEIQGVGSNDPTHVGVTYLGAAGEASTPVGATLVDGSIVSNRVLSTPTQGTGTLHLPFFADADPALLAIVGVEFDLAPDGSGGYDGLIRGGVSADSATAATVVGIQQMLAHDPQAHVTLASLLDADDDGVITANEIATNATIDSVLASDLAIAGTPVLSFGFQIHLLPCATGTCVVAPPTDTCHDRVLDGDETDVDCGGSCGACGGPATCAAADDCQTDACNDHQCAPPTCTDGHRDGFESGVDCGGPCKSCS